MIRRTLLTLSRSDRIKNLASAAPVSRDVVKRFVAGETADDAVAATRVLVEDGRLVTIDHLGEDTLDVAQADLRARRTSCSCASWTQPASRAAPRCR